VKLACAILVGFVSSACLARTQTSESARQFVTAIYQAYSRPDAPSSLDPTQERRIFSPALLADIRRDRPASGEVGKLDHDPLCDCQDPDGLKVISITVAPATHGRAVAHVRLMFNVAITPITLTLVETHSGWRVDDVGTASSTSLRKFLIDNNEH
jgi:hypothetical protein